MVGGGFGLKTMVTTTKLRLSTLDTWRPSAKNSGILRDSRVTRRSKYNEYSVVGYHWYGVHLADNLEDRRDAIPFPSVEHPHSRKGITQSNGEEVCLWVEIFSGTQLEATRGNHIPAHPKEDNLRNCWQGTEKVELNVLGGGANVHLAV